MHNAHNRNASVKINYENIKSGYEQCFEAVSAEEGTDLGFEYDYESILHYGRTAFSSNGNDTITTLVIYLFNFIVYILKAYIFF